MKKINNPFPQYKDYDCFGCSPNNPIGLKMEFFEIDDEIVAYWEPSDFYQGWNKVLHGGIQATLMDEIASWLVFAKLKTSGVTSKMEIRLKRPIYTNKGKLTLKAKLKAKYSKIAEIDVKLIDAEGIVCAESIMHYFFFPEDVAKEKHMYPGYEKFINE